MKESEIERVFCKKLQKLGCLTPKISDNPGWPDRLIITPGGKHFFIEFKRPGGKLSVIQTTVINQISRLGHFVFVIDSYSDEDVDTVLKSV